MCKKYILIPVLFLPVYAYCFLHNPNSGGQQQPVDKSVSAGCLPPSTSAELNVNNVRALIHSGGDMWWDLIGNARYEVPKGSGRHSLFVGSLWIGGRDAQTNTLKMAAQRYRNNGVDFWSGPLTNDGSASIDPQVCSAYDRIFAITRAEVEEFCLCNPANGTNPNDPVCDNYSVPQSILEWPGNNPSNGLDYDTLLAPYADLNKDNYYQPEQGEYPLYDLTNSADCQAERKTYLYGDFTLWWVFNDKGNAHGESAGTPIGLEVRAQGFGFNTNDEVNNMTFYNYEIINRGTTTLAQCYFGVNTDADLGGAGDDYTGCDVERGFGYMYNGDSFDDNFAGVLGYGLHPPAVGIDFFEGPYVDKNGVADRWDNNWSSSHPEVTQAFTDLTDTSTQSISFGINGMGYNDTITDNERFGMRRFVFYNNGNCTSCDPTNAAEYYNYLQGKWRDGSRMVYGGNGYPSGSFTNAPHADFMFPAGSDKFNWGTKGNNPPFLNWKEENTGASPNAPGDRRFVQSAGPFTLKPGAVNDITLGVVWARATSGDPFQSVLKVLSADMKAQSLFDNCFRVLNGPNAPDVSVQELDRELILYLTNKTAPLSNNYLNQYEERNYFIPERDLVSTPIDSNMYMPSFTVFIHPTSGDSIFVYQDQVDPAHAADTLIISYFMSNPVDTVFGYYSNQSTLQNVIVGNRIDTVEYDQMIRFEGYLIYQLADATVTSTDIFGPDGSNKARLVAQCDVRNFDENGNPIGRLVNYRYDEQIQASVPMVMVNGTNEGIVHSFRITEDQFATGDKRLVNHKTYYYMALAYGYNNYKTYNPDDPGSYNGQKEPFFLGRKNIRVYTAIPHIVSPENGGTIMNTLYGMGPQITRIEGRGNGGNLLMLTRETEEAILQSPNHRMDHITYDYGMGPVKVKVIDPLSLAPKRYRLKIADTTTQIKSVVSSGSRWILIDQDELIEGDSIVAISDRDISQPYEQIVYDRRNGKFLGFSISIAQTQNVGPKWSVLNENVVKSYLPEVKLEINGVGITTAGNGLISATVEYENPNDVWLGWFPDKDGPNPLNWVRSGTSDNDDDPSWNSNYYRQTLNNGPNAQSEKIFIDPEQVFQRGVSFYGGGGLVPYLLTSAISVYDGNMPGNSLGSVRVFSINTTPTSSQNNQDVGSILVKDMLDYINSIDIVLTPDRDKWTRCPVFELQDNSTYSYRDPQFPGSGTPAKLDLRFSPSIDKNGNPADVNAGASNNEEDANYINPWGMGWFPGYVIDVETGQRLNIGYGEDSYLVGDNGRDMLFNPGEADPDNTQEGWYTSNGDFIFGGKHHLYIFGSNPKENSIDSMPHYDQGRHIMKKMTNGSGVPVSNTGAANGRDIWRNCMWAGIPFHVKGTAWLNSEIRIHLRVNKQYQSGYSSLRTSLTPQNKNNPLYSFSFADMAPTTHVQTTGASAMDLIQVVPNPYYASSEYENTPLDNRVKIVNLPERCTISIYSLSGTLVRRFEKGDASTSLDWDLKNFKNIPIASGLYIIHVQADGLGERILKWYGVLRPPQLDTF